MLLVFLHRAFVWCCLSPSFVFLYRAPPPARLAIEIALLFLCRVFLANRSASVAVALTSAFCSPPPLRSSDPSNRSVRSIDRKPFCTL